MGSFVLVPGGWQGGWAYDRVAEMLRARGHAVRAVTPAGLEADPEAVAGPTPNLSSHIDQVVSCIRNRGGEPVILCGHSYGGMVIAGAADAVPERIARLVFIDAYAPGDGDSCWTLTSDMFRSMFVAGAAHDGRLVAVPEGLDARARPHPLASFLQVVTLRSPAAAALPRTFIGGGPWPGSPFVELAARLRSDPRWDVHEIPVGHNIMRRDPVTLSGVLAAIAEGEHVR